MPLNVAMLPLLFLSGLASLMHEVIWLRLFTLTFGNTAQAGAVVLGSFMGGLALGSWLIGRRGETTPRPYRLYGLLELGVAAAAALLLAGYLGADRLYAAVFRAADGNAAALALTRALVALALLAAPCALMGGTLPVLVRAAAPGPEASGRDAGRLYAVNTFGAVLGVLTAGLATIRWWGVWPTAWAAVGLNALVGLAALALSLRESPPPPTAPAAPAAPATAEQRLALILAAAVGGYALALEVLYARIIVFAVSYTIYIWTIILAVYLAGLALGSALAARRSQRSRSPLADAARCLLGMAVSAWAYLALIKWLASKFLAVIEFLGDGGVARSLELQMAFTALTLLPLALFSGAAFPFLVRSYVGPDRAAGRRTGALYAANTAAGVVGSLAAGFVLLPTIGAQWSLFGLTVVFYAAAAGVLLRLAPRRLAAATWLCGGALAALLAALLPGPRLLSDLLVKRFPGEHRVLMSHEDAAATVTVLESHGSRMLTVNDTPVAGSGDLLVRNTQVLQGCMPLAAHPNPRRAVMIGFGAGETADIIAKAGVTEFDAAELCPGVFAAAAWFHSVNNEIERARLPRRLVIDGKNYLKLTPRRFDLVLNDSVHPSYLGNASLYCRDHFAAGRRVLADDGVMTSWLPVYQLDLPSLRSIVRTFASVFPNCGLVYAHTCFNYHALLIGKKQPGPLLSLARLQALFARDDLRPRLAQIEVDEPLDLINFLALGPRAIAANFGDAPLITDNHPTLEFDAARQPLQDFSVFWNNVRYLASLREDPMPYVDLAGAADVPALLAAQPARYRAAGMMLEIVADNDLFPFRAQAMVDDAAAVSPGVAGARSLKDHVLANMARGRQAPATVGSKRRQQAAEAAAQAGRWDEAAAILQTEIDKNPANFKALGALGSIRLQQRDVAGAAQLLRKALALHPRDALAEWRLSEVAAMRGNRREAEERLQRALELFGPAPPLYGELGQLKRERGDVAGALAMFREGLRRFPAEYSLHLACAETLHDAGQTEEAVQILRRAAELNPGDWRAPAMLQQMTGSADR